jgi:hypothetical protein
MRMNKEEFEKEWNRAIEERGFATLEAKGLKGRYSVSIIVEEYKMVDTNTRLLLFKGKEYIGTIDLKLISGVI